MVPFPSPSALRHVRLEVGHRLLHHLGGLQHERQLHRPGPEQLSDGLHPVQQDVVDDLQSGSRHQCFIQIGLQAVLVAVDDALLEPLLQRHRRQLGGAGLLACGRGHPVEHVEQLLERVVALTAPVVDHVESDSALLVGDPRHRQDLGGVHDRRVQPGLHTLRQEDRVQHLAGRRVQPERDVRESQRGQHVGVAPLEFPDGLDGLDAVAAGLLLAGGDRERETVHHDGTLGEPVLGGDLADQPLGDGQLGVLGAGLPLLVDGQCDHGSAVLADQLHGRGVARGRAVTVLEVDRVDDGASAEVLQTCLQHGRLGRVEHDRQRRCGGETRSELAHVGDTVATDVVDAQVQQVGAVAGLRAGDLHAAVPVLGEHGLAERLAAVGVRALADHQHRRVLFERDRLVERRQARFRPRSPLGRLHRADRLDDLTHVLRGGAAAAADEAETELGDEAGERLGQLLRPERVHRALGAQLRQPGVGHHRDRSPGVPGEVAQVLAHLGRPGGAVQADEVDAERLQRGQRRTDLAAEEHGAGGLDRDVADDRYLLAAVGHRALRADDRRLRLQQVLAGLDHDGVDAAVEHSGDLLLVGVAQQRVGRVPESGQFGARPDGAQHPAGPVGGGEGVGLGTGQRGRGQRELLDPVDDVVLGEVRPVGAEGVGLDRVDTDLEILPVHGADDVRPGDGQDLVAAVEAGVIVQRGVVGLQHGAHRAVRHDHLGGERSKQRVVR